MSVLKPEADCGEVANSAVCLSRNHLHERLWFVRDKGTATYFHLGLAHPIIRARFHINGLR